MSYSFLLRNIDIIKRLPLRGNVIPEVEFIDGLSFEDAGGDDDFVILEWVKFLKILKCETIVFHSIDDDTLEEFWPSLIQNPCLKNIKFSNMPLGKFMTLEKERGVRGLCLTLTSPFYRGLKAGSDYVLPLSQMSLSSSPIPSDLKFRPLTHSTPYSSPDRSFKKAGANGAGRSLPPPSDPDLLAIPVPGNDIPTKFGLEFSEMRLLGGGVSLRIYNHKVDPMAQSLFVYINNELQKIFTIPKDAPFSCDDKKITILSNGIEIFY